MGVIVCIKQILDPEVPPRNFQVDRSGGSPRRPLPFAEAKRASGERTNPADAFCVQCPCPLGHDPGISELSIRHRRTPGRAGG